MIQNSNDRMRGAQDRTVSHERQCGSTSGQAVAYRRATFFGLALLVAALPALAGFGPEESIFPDITANAIAVGDIDGDGRDDIVMLAHGPDSEPNSVRISLQRPDGSMGNPITVAIDDPPMFNEVIRLVDMTGDGLPDIVIGALDGIWVLTNQGGMQFTSQVLPVEYVTDLAVDDFDGDGHRDVIAVSSGTFVILLGDGAGGLGEPTTHAAGYSTNHFQLVDTDGDGHLDVAFLDGDRIRFLERDATGFTGGSRYSVVPIRNDSLSRPAFADFNGDGLIDYAIGKRTNADSKPVVVLVMQKPGGRFQAIQSLKTLDLPDNLVFHDVDNDGRLDLLVPHPGWSGVSVYRSNGRNLLMEERYPAYSARSPHAIATGDLNGDGRLDIVSASPTGGLRFLPGQADTRGADPHVKTTVDAASATIRLGNGGDRVTTSNAYLEVDITARHGGVQAGDLPPECANQPWDDAGVRITCWLPPLQAGADVTLVLPLAGINDTSLNRLTVDARLSAGDDLRPDNNRSRAQGLVLPVAKSRASKLPGK